MVELNNRNEIITDENMATNLPGVFAAGDSDRKSIDKLQRLLAMEQLQPLAQLST